MFSGSADAWICLIVISWLCNLTCLSKVNVHPFWSRIRHVCSWKITGQFTSSFANCSRYRMSLPPLGHLTRRMLKTLGSTTYVRGLGGGSRILLKVLDPPFWISRAIDKRRSRLFCKKYHCKLEVCHNAKTVALVRG